MRRTHQNRPWSDVDLETFRKMWGDGAMVREIMTTLNRTEFSVECMRRALNLTKRHRGGIAVHHPIQSMQPGESIIRAMTEQGRRNWINAAIRKNISITTKAVMLKGEVHYRITRLAA